MLSGLKPAYIRDNYLCYTGVCANSPSDFTTCGSQITDISGFFHWANCDEQAGSIQSSGAISPEAHVHEVKAAGVTSHWNSLEL